MEEKFLEERKFISYNRSQYVEEKGIYHGPYSSSKRAMCKKYLSCESVDDLINYLKEVSDKMKATGYTGECIEVTMSFVKEQDEKNDIIQVIEFNNKDR